MKKKLFLVVVAVAVMLAVGVAYAWFSSQDVVADNVISTGGVTISASDTSMSFTGLMPTDDIANAKTQFMWVRNDGTEPIMFYAYAQHKEGNSNLYAVVNARITLAPDDYPTDAGTLAASLGRAGGGNWLVYEGPISGILGPENGKAELRTLASGDVHTPLDPGQYALYKVQVWLSSSAGNGFQNQSALTNMVFVGGQDEAWPDF